MKNQRITNSIDWYCVIIYSILVIMGWMNIYSSSLSSTEGISSKQLIFILLSIPLIFTIIFTDGKFYEKYASVIYVFSIISLAGLLVFGKTIAGQRCWYSFGGITFQPSEFAKAATALALAKFLSNPQISLKDFKTQVQVLLIIGLPVFFILLQPDPGSAMIYVIFIVALYREGFPSWYLWTGFIAILLFILTLKIEPIYISLIALIIVVIAYYKSRLANRNIFLSALIFISVTGFVFSVDYVFENLFKQHHRDRFNILLGQSVDVKGIGYNTNQSKIAIGSGGWYGKGFLEGTQTKGGFVPEQHTDYIFTTVGEEWGFVGCITVISLFVTLLLRIIYLAERQKTKFSRIYGYCVASVLFMHFFVNIAMVVEIFPTVGVPLPFFSYGGSGLWGFSILLFIFIKMDANKVNEW